jgi:hypothetical protein
MVLSHPSRLLLKVVGSDLRWKFQVWFHQEVTECNFKKLPWYRGVCVFGDNKVTKMILFIRFGLGANVSPYGYFSRVPWVSISFYLSQLFFPGIRSKSKAKSLGVWFLTILLWAESLEWDTGIAKLKGDLIFAVLATTLHPRPFITVSRWCQHPSPLGQMMTAGENALPTVGEKGIAVPKAAPNYSG